MGERSVLIIVDFHCSMGGRADWNNVLLELEINSSGISNLNSAFDSLSTNLKSIVNSNQGNTVVFRFELNFVLLLEESVVDNIGCVICDVVEPRTVEKRNGEFVIRVVVNEGILRTAFNVFSDGKQNFVIDREWNWCGFADFKLCTARMDLDYVLL